MSNIVEKMRGFWGDVSNRDIIEAADEIERLRSRSETLEAALREVRDAIINADPAVLTCTLWMPESMAETVIGKTVVDYIDAALSPAPSEGGDDGKQ